MVPILRIAAVTLMVPAVVPLAAGAGLVLFAPTGSAGSVHVVPAVGAGSSRVVVGGAF